ncbi:hypothetical protein [Nitrospira sp. BLG_1]|uniref:exo-rhamnogalacturonan lyase family protein n=1 Tax=Nitrospira sp. BLG_1 TaxID=3395883 RepID=UPI0039BC50AC
MRGLYLFLTATIVTLGLGTSSVLSAPLCEGALVCGVHFVPPAPKQTARPQAFRAFSDRKVYWASDPVAHIVVSFLGEPGVTNPRRAIDVQVTDASGAVVGRHHIPTNLMIEPDLEFFLDLQQLSIGKFMVATQLLDEAMGAVLTTASISFERVNQNRPAAALPVSIPLQVGSQSVLSNAQWPVTMGIPFPEGTLFDAQSLGVFENGVRIPAQLIPRAMWRPLGGSIKWLGVDFTARYDGMVPRTYTLQHVSPTSPTPSSPLKVSQTPKTISVETGPLKFRVNRQRFAGIEQVFFKENNHAPMKQTLRSGKPFLVDEAGTLYTSDNGLLPDQTMPGSGVELEEFGPQRVTLRASGWYISATGNKLCQFVTRISAYANQPFIRISHRTILTYDTRQNRIQDLGWDNHTLVGAGTYAFGIEGSKPVEGPAPKRGKTTFLHQEKGDAFRLVDGNGATLTTGRHADGWLAVKGLAPKFPHMVIGIKDIYQKYPKELELDNVIGASQPPGNSGSQLHQIVHFWPKHGRTVFEGSPVDTAQEHIYKLRYAHQGRLMQLQPPVDYTNAVTGYLTEELNGHPDGDGEVSGMNSANGQGLVINNELLLSFHSSSTPSDRIQAQVALFREDPHALASSEWNAASEVLGKLSSVDRQFDPATERALEIAMPGYLHGIVEQGDEYGMWIYGNIHNSWDPAHGRALIHRVWNASHYQNVWGDWMLYFRSGNPAHLRWARVHSDHHMDIDTNNFDDGSAIHGRAGYMYHVKGFLPWGGDSGLHEHWINPAAFMLRYYLTGDRRALDLARTWFAVAGPGSLTPLGAPQAGLQCKDWANSFMRDRVSYLGEMTDYYTGTWDPHALMAMSDESQYLLNVPFECTGSPGDHPIWTRQWFTRYYDLTHDSRMVDRFVSWSTAGFNDLVVNAFLYQITGNSDYLRRVQADFYDTARIYYDSSGERYHGYGPWVSAVNQVWLQEAPYFLQALKAAGFRSERGEKRVTYPGGGAHFPDAGSPPGYPTRGWSDSSTVVLALTQTGRPLDVSMDALKSFGDPRGQMFVVSGPPRPPEAITSFVLSTKLFDTEYFPTSAYPLTFHLPDPTPNTLYRVEVRSGPPRIFAPYTNLPEASVLRRRKFANGCEPQFSQMGMDRQLFMLSPSRPHENNVTLRLSAINGKDNIYSPSAMPVYFRIDTPAGLPIHEGNLFLYGNRKTADVSLPAPAQTLGTPESQPMWRFYSASTYGPKMEIVDGAEEILFSTGSADLTEIWNALPQVATNPIVCP